MTKRICGCFLPCDVRLVCLIVVFISYLCFGSLVFGYLEEPEESKTKSFLRKLREEFLQNNSCLSDEDLEAFIIKIVQANNRGFSAVRNATMQRNWSFGQSLFFSGTIVTTIGYGHVSPLSDGGKAFAIVYALIGIPLTLILLTALVERLMFLTTRFLYYLNSKLGHLYQPFNIRLIHLIVVIALAVLFFYIIPAIIFSAIEKDWNFLSALYYCFISLTTIGLGDYVPGEQPDQPYRALYKICTTGYLIIGLTIMMLILSILYEIPQLNFGIFFLSKSDEQDPEKIRINPGSSCGPKYSPQIDEATPTEGQDGSLDHRSTP